MSIKFSKPNIFESDLKLVKKTIKSGWLTHGKNTTKFEEKFKEYTNSKYSVTVSSCTAALHLSCLALGLKKGDEVIVPAMSHTATSHAVEYTGAKTVFIDIDLENAYIHKKIDNKTRHVGNFGVSGCFSFYPTKQITTGEGGMLVTNNKNFYNKIRKLKAFGIDKDINQRTKQGTYDVVSLGFNYRLTDFQSALGLKQIENYKENLKKRHLLAKRYTNSLQNIQQVKCMSYSSDCSFFVFQIFCKDRDRLLKEFKIKNF